MAIAMVFDAKGVTEAQYEQVRAEVGMSTTRPKGMLYHAAGPSEGGWNVFEVWESQEDARSFFEEKLGKALEHAHIDVKPRVFEVHAVMG